MATTADFKNGLCIVHNHDIYQIVEFQHVKPGKGAAFVRTKLKSLTNGRVLENTFSAGVKVTTARVERRKFQYLYNDDSGYHFMDLETFEQIFLNGDLIDSPQFLKEGQEADILFHTETEKILFCELPQFVEQEVTYTEPGVRGDTATNVMKPATVESGATVNVPLFVNIGDKIKIDTRNNAYVERVK